MEKIIADIEFYEFSELGFLFYKARMDKGVTQKDLGKLFRVTKTTISLLESGQKVRIGLDKLMGMAEYLGFEFKVAKINRLNDRIREDIRKETRKKY